jgi:tellurite resistance protein TerC
MWAGFFAIVLVMLAIDLFVVGGGKQHKVSPQGGGHLVGGLGRGLVCFRRRRCGGTSTAALRARGGQPEALEFVTGYLIEKSLAVDNVFVWLMLFSFFAVPLELQKRVLVYGVLGAIVLRTIMIFAGAG